MRLPLPENSATEPSGFQITISACAFLHAPRFENAVRADPVANVAQPLGGLGVERLTGFPSARRAGSCYRARATSRIASATSPTGRSASIMTMPGMRRIHFRWYAAKRSVPSFELGDCLGPGAA